MACIYALIDLRTDEIRYVGKTDRARKTPKRRLYEHIYEAEHGAKRYVYNWVRQLLSLNLLPIIDVLEEAPDDNWQWYETWWIVYGRVVGWRLTNVTMGGDGLNKPSEETRRKLSDAKSGENNPQFGKPPSEESNRKRSEALSGRKHSDEHKRKNGEAHRGEKASSAKLTESDVHDIRQMFRDGKKDREIAEIYEVSKGLINNIRHGRKWTWLKDLGDDSE